MKAEDKTQVLLLGIEDGLLWQLTKALAAAGDRIVVHVARDFSVAVEMCTDRTFDAIVVDGWEQSWQAGYALGWDKVSGMRPRHWVVLVDSVPMPGLLEKDAFSSAVFMEKPFNPKEFPSFLLNLSAGPDDYGVRLASLEEDRAGAAPTSAGHFLVSGERYRPPTNEEGPVSQQLEAQPRVPEAEPRSPLVSGDIARPDSATMIHAAEPLQSARDLVAAGSGILDSGMVSALEAPAAQDLVGAGSETPDYGAVSALPIMAGEDRGAVSPPPAPVPVSLESASGAAVEEPRQPAPEPTPQESPEAEAAPEPASPDSDFDFLVESGFVCLRKKDYAGAHAHWNRAAALRPDDRRLKANLRRLDKLAE